MSVDELLPEAYSAKSSEYQKGTDTMDVWFDSGMDRMIDCHYNFHSDH